MRDNEEFMGLGTVSYGPSRLLSQDNPFSESLKAFER